MIKISYVIPVYNEKNTVAEAIKQIININLKNQEKEIIVIDNGSTDGSQEIIKKFKKIKNFKFILRKKNLGYGASITRGAKMSNGKYIYIQMSDIEYDHEVSLKMYKLAERHKADAVFGSRLKGKNYLKILISVIRKPSFLATIIITSLYNILYNKEFTDVIGSKLYKTIIFKKIKIKEQTKTWSVWDFELKNRLISGPYTILETFTKYKPRQNFLKKNVKPHHLIYMIYVILRFKFCMKKRY